MADNKDISRPLDSEELTAEQEEKVSGGMESENAVDRPPIFNVSYFNSSFINTSYLNK